MCFSVLCMYSFVNCHSCSQYIIFLLKYLSLLFICKKAFYFGGINLLSAIYVKNVFFLFLVYLEISKLHFSLMNNSDLQN